MSKTVAMTKGKKHADNSNRNEKFDFTFSLNFLSQTWYIFCADLLCKIQPSDAEITEANDDKRCRYYQWMTNKWLNMVSSRQLCMYGVFPPALQEWQHKDETMRYPHDSDGILESKFTFRGFASALYCSTETRVKCQPGDNIEWYPCHVIHGDQFAQKVPQHTPWVCD